MVQKQTSSSFSSTWSWLCNLEGASQPSYLSVLSHYPGEPDAEPDSRTVFPGGDVPLRDRRNWRFTRNKQYIIKIKLSCMFFRTYWSFGNITLLLNWKNVSVVCWLDVEQMFSSVHNCVYFSIKVLELISTCLQYLDRYTLNCVHCALYSVHFALYSVHFALYSVHFALYSVNFALYSVHFALYRVQFALYSVHCVHWPSNILKNLSKVWYISQRGF